MFRAPHFSGYLAAPRNGNSPALPLHPTPQGYRPLITPFFPALILLSMAFGPIFKGKRNRGQKWAAASLGV